MGHSTIDLFATNEELIALAHDFAEENDLWVTVIRFPSLIVCGRPWASIESHVRQPIAPDERMEIVLTAIEPNLAGVREGYGLLQKNLFPEWVTFRIACADNNCVLESAVMTWLSEGSQWAKKVRSLLRNIRKNTMAGIWAFTADMSVREFYSNLTRYTKGAKALQDAGARVSDSVDDPPRILGADCPYPLSEARIFDRKARASRGGNG